MGGKVTYNVPVDNSIPGRIAALQKLGLATDYSDVHAKLRELAKPTLFNRFEGMFSGKPDLTKSDADIHTTAQTLRDQLRKRYNVTPHLTGSLPLGLNLPGDADIDFFVRAESPTKFQKLTDKFHKSEFTPSAYNTPGAGYHVFTNTGKPPVDLAVATGPEAKDYAASLKRTREIANTLPQDLRQALIQKKHTLKHTPFDIKAKRYKEFKRQLDQVMGATRLARKPANLKKTGAVVDLSDPHQLDKFTRFVNDENLYGHRTHNLQSVLDQGHLSAALEALKQRQLKSYEAGSTQGSHTAVPYTDLSPEDLGHLERNILSETPNIGAYGEIAQRLGSTEDQVKANFIRQHYNKIRQFLRTQKDPEAFRRANLAVPKLGPNIFLTRGGVLDTPAYGNASLLFHTQRAAPSPFMNLVTNEYVVPPKDVLTPQRVPVRHGYALLPQADIAGFEKTHPEMKYVAQESLPENLRAQLFKPTHDIKETWERWAPAAASGKLEVLETR